MLITKTQSLIAHTYFLDGYANDKMLRLMFY